MKKCGDNSLCLHYAHQNQNGGGAKAKNGFVNTAYSRQISSSTTQSGSGDGRGGEGGLFDSPKPRYMNWVEQKGMTSLFSSLLNKEGRRKAKTGSKVMTFCSIHDLYRDIHTNALILSYHVSKYLYQTAI